MAIIATSKRFGAVRRLGPPTHMVAWTVGIAQLVRFVNHHNIPWHGADVRLHGAGKIERRDDDAIREEWGGIAVGLGTAVGDGIKNDRRQVEFFFQFQTPLFADGRWTNDQRASSSLSPKLAKNERSFDGFAEADSSARITPLRGFECE
jgi:hypothetical protein